ncbi:metalloendopeptidase OMA1, mitochondrial-like isoform X2 [Ptiloglossa arizonensis]|uniref:metalloendopeptidase OMA1, mitochondrial-like isoform X2 n=1 Tax=Ptiloglossa arizonensis TaxID=3350558 RepID=UPI003F9FC6B5
MDCLFLVQTLQFGPILTGWCVRHWWMKKALTEQDKYKRWYWQRRNIFLGSLGLFSSILMIYYLTHFERDPVLKRRRFIIFNKAEQAELGRFISRKLFLVYKDNLIPRTDPIYWKLSMIIRKLLVANKEIFANTEWTINVVDMPLTNAMILPDGNIFIFSGIFNMVKNDDQLTFILAHEMSHVLLLHMAELFSYEMVKKIIFSIPTFFIWMCFAKWKALLIDLGTGFFQTILFSFPYKRRLEIEADDLGFQLAAKSCIDLREVLVFWKYMDKFSNDTGQSKYQIPFLMTHPSHKSRERKLARQLLKALKLRAQAGCPPLPIEDPRNTLK